MSANTEWLAGDWGGSNLRLWHVCSNDHSTSPTIVAQLHSAQGATTLSGAEFATVLDATLSAWSPAVRHLPLLLCGMVGSKRGWCEAPYLNLEALQQGDLTAWARRFARLAISPRTQCYLVPGLCQRAATPHGANVMRGEEMQVLGFLQQHPHYTGYLCLPGTHSKWVWLKVGRIAHFSTAMTGELFALLSQHSLLAACVAAEADVSTANTETSFARAVQLAYAQGETTLHRLFAIRAQSLLENTPPAEARAYLSGWLIGLELAGLQLPPSYCAPITFIGTPALCQRYRAALQLIAPQIATPLVDGQSAVLAGLALVQAQL